MAAQENRYSLAAAVVTAADDHAVVAVSDSWKPDLSSGADGFKPATSAIATVRYVLPPLKFKVNEVAPPAVALA